MAPSWLPSWLGGGTGATLLDESSGLLGGKGRGGAGAGSSSAGGYVASSSASSSSSSYDDGKTSMLLTACNFMNGVVGAGIIGLPGALNEAGFSLGIFLCVVVAILSAWTIRLLAEVGGAHSVYTYQDLSQRAFGPAGYYLVCLFQGLFAFGAMCSYLVIFADTVPAVLRATTDWGSTQPAAVDRVNILLTGACIVLLPLCLLRQYSQLAKFSVIKFFAITFLTGSVSVFVCSWGKGSGGRQSPLLVSCAHVKPPPLSLSFLSLSLSLSVQVVYFKYVLQDDVASVKNDEWRYEEVHASPFPALGSIAFAFVCHHQTFLALGSLRNPTARRFTVTVNMAITGSFTVSIIMAIFGYTTFWETTKGDIFVNYEAFEKVRLSPSRARMWHGTECRRDVWGLQGEWGCRIIGSSSSFSFDSSPTSSFRRSGRPAS
jgi:sodium-coupled neutral amino acid transporter 11